MNFNQGKGELFEVLQSVELPVEAFPFSWIFILQSGNLKPELLFKTSEPPEPAIPPANDGGIDEQFFPSYRRRSS